MAVGTDHLLPAVLACREGAQHRPAAWGRKVDASKREQILQAESRSGAAQIGPQAGQEGSPSLPQSRRHDHPSRRAPTTGNGRAAKPCSTRRPARLAPRRAERCPPAGRVRRDRRADERVVIAYGMSTAGASRGRAASVRAMVSCTRSSTRSGSDTRAWTTRRTTATSSSSSSLCRRSVEPLAIRPPGGRRRTPGSPRRTA